MDEREIIKFVGFLKNKYNVEIKEIPSILLDEFNKYKSNRINNENKCIVINCIGKRCGNEINWKVSDSGFCTLHINRQKKGYEIKTVIDIENTACDNATTEINKMIKEFKTPQRSLDDILDKFINSI